MTQTEGLKSTRVPTCTRQLKELHRLARLAGLDTREGKREQYEAFLLKTIGRTSTRQATRQEREKVIDELRRRTDAGYRLAHARPVEAVDDSDAADVLGVLG